MFPEFTNSLSILRPASVASTATAVCTFDSKGADSLKIKVNSGTAATTSALYTTLKITESDTVTNASSQSAIVALTGGTNVVADSTGFVLPLCTTGLFDLGGVVEFQIDLRKRKRYIGVTMTPVQTLVVGIDAELYRQKESKDTAVTKYLSNLEATTTTASRQIVSAL